MRGSSGEPRSRPSRKRGWSSDHCFLHAEAALQALLRLVDQVGRRQPTGEEVEPSTGADHEDLRRRINRCLSLLACASCRRPRAFADQAALRRWGKLPAWERDVAGFVMHARPGRTPASAAGAGGTARRHAAGRRPGQALGRQPERGPAPPLGCCRRHGSRSVLCPHCLQPSGSLGARFAVLALLR